MVLPFSTTTPLRTWTFQGYPWGMVWSLPAARTWFYNFHINLCVPHDLFEHLDWGVVFADPIIGFPQLGALGFIEAGPGVEKYDSGTQAVESVAAALAEGSCAHVYVDDYEMPDRPAFRRAHHLHELLLTGYARDTRTFSGPYYGRDGTFVLRQVPENLLARAFNRTLAMGMRTYRTCPAPPRSEFCLGLVERQYREYLGGVRAGQKFPWFDNGPFSQKGDTGHWYGHEGCLRIMDYLLECERTKTKPDLRVTRQLWELKAAAVKRLDLLAEALGGPPSTDPRVFHEVATLARELHLRAVQATATGVPRFQHTVVQLTAALHREATGIQELLGNVTHRP